MTPRLFVYMGKREFLKMLVYRFGVGRRRNYEKMSVLKYYFTAISAVVCLASCDDEELSKIPTVPTSFSIADGEIINNTVVTLDADGSKVGNGAPIRYSYYLGTSKDNLEEVETNVKLTPYTQYFWYVVARTDDGEETPSKIRTFYCVPDNKVKVERDCGNGKWASVLRFKNLPVDKLAGGKVTITPDHNGYEMDPIVLSAGQDSCYVESSQLKTCVHGFDDEHGILYQPVIYTFDAELIIRVGDKDIPKRVSAENIFLNKDLFVCDSEFNVYRVVKIGNQTWLADDFRATSYVDFNGEIVQLKEGRDYFVSTLASGAKGILYDVWMRDYIPDLINQIKGYRLFDTKDWETLLDFYNPKGDDRHLSYEENCYILDCLTSQYDWAEKNTTSELMGLFNAKPFGWVTLNEINGDIGRWHNGDAACYYYGTIISYDDIYNNDRRDVYTTYNFIRTQDDDVCQSLRFIKD
ncbi:MAG: hypothetical protein MJZ01_08040 [Bacteroidales bacterium]|nr:hypothetical protein [Bacteroidales bacterium]